MPEDLRSLRLRVEAVIVAEESQAWTLLQAADQFDGQPLADHLRDQARDHRVQVIKLRARLNALLDACGEPDSH